MKRFIQQFSLAVSVSAMLFIGCAAPSDGDTPAGKENAGYVWGRAGVWNIGDAAAAEIWQQWTSHFDTENLEGLLALAHDSIFFELSPTEQIDGIAAFEQRKGLKALYRMQIRITLPPDLFKSSFKSFGYLKSVHCYKHCSPLGVYQQFRYFRMFFHVNPCLIYVT